jgi:hypothetical protein
VERLSERRLRFARPCYDKSYAALVAEELAGW